MQSSQPQKNGILRFISVPAGHGSQKGAEQTCTTCHGTGIQVLMQQIIPGLVQQMSTRCQSCKGRGKKISLKDRCKACAGRQIVRKKKVQKVCVSKGAVRKNGGHPSMTLGAILRHLATELPRRHEGWTEDCYRRGRTPGAGEEAGRLHHRLGTAEASTFYQVTSLLFPPSMRDTSNCSTFLKPVIYCGQDGRRPVPLNGAAAGGGSVWI